MEATDPPQSPAAETAPAEDPEFEVTTRDQFNLSFRTRLVFPVKTTVHMVGSEGMDVAVNLRSAFVLEDERVEYTGKIESAPPHFAHWVGTLTLRDHRSDGLPAEAPSLVEQRRAQRLRRTFQIMSRDLHHYKALSADISETGLRLMADEPLPIGKSMQLTMDFDDSQYPHLKCRAEVVWCRPKDARYWWVGLKFTQMSPEHQQLAINYLRYADQPAPRRAREGGADDAAIPRVET